MAMSLAIIIILDLISYGWCISLIDLQLIKEDYINSVLNYTTFLTSTYFNLPAINDEEFDFIIVGSGAAGSVLANRLSENSRWKILLLEAGNEPSSLVDVPFVAPFLQQTEYNWGYLAEKQLNMCLGLENQRMAWPRGKSLGGTSNINHNIYTRGNKIDYDRWASMGNDGWSYREVLPYFKKSEDSLVKISDNGYHGYGGNLGVQDVPFRSKGTHSFIRAMKERGYRYVDYNGETQMGVSYMQATLRRGRRCSALRAFLNTARLRPNLKIFTRSRATKILIDDATKRAYGVEYVRDRRYFIAKAKKEVILSAGALNSPQLLMLSGIGPKEHLREVNITPIVDLPVGKKIYDHISYLGMAVLINQTDVALNPFALLQDSNVLPQFLLEGKGPLTHLGSMEAIAFIRTEASDDPDETYPDVELLYSGGHLSTDKNLVYRKNTRVTQLIYDKVYKPLENKHVISINPMLLHPKSIGYMKLKSKNPFHSPKFYGNYFTDKGNADVKTFIAAIREIQQIVDTQAFRRYGAKILPTPIPGCEREIPNSDRYWECALRHITITLHHQVASCKMGPEGDKEAVVDNELKLHGMKNVRVVDTSVIPLPLSAHTNAPAYMVGEKGADIIKNEWEKISAVI